MHTVTFTSPLKIGETVTGYAEGPWYRTEFSGVYHGVTISQWDGRPVHSFGAGIIGTTPQGCFAHPATAQQIADAYLELIHDNGTTDAVRDALNGDDRYEVVGELQDVAVESCGWVAGDPETDDALYAMADDAVDIVKAWIATFHGVV